MALAAAGGGDDSELLLEEIGVGHGEGFVHQLVGAERLFKLHRDHRKEVVLVTDLADIDLAGVFTQRQFKLSRIAGEIHMATGSGHLVFGKLGSILAADCGSEG